MENIQKSMNLVTFAGIYYSSFRSRKNRYNKYYKISNTDSHKNPGTACVMKEEESMLEKIVKVVGGAALEILVILIANGRKG